MLPARPDVARATLRALAVAAGRATRTRDRRGAGQDRPRVVAAGARSACAGPAGRCATASSATTAPPTRPRWFLVLLASLGDRALATELEAAWRAAGGWLERALERGGGLGPPRAAPGAGRPRPAGLARRRGSRRPRLPRRRHPDAPDGEVPEPPLADADTQAVAVVALAHSPRSRARSAGPRRRRGSPRAIERGFRPRDARHRRATASRCRAPAPSSAGCCGRTPCPRPPASGRPSGSAPRRAHPLGPAHALLGAPAVRARRLPSRRRLAVRLLARLGRPASGRAPGGGGAAAPRESSTRSRRSARRRSSSRSAPDGPASRSRSPTASRPGPSAPAGRSSTSGTAGRRRLRLTPARRPASSRGFYLTVRSSVSRRPRRCRG